MSPKTLDLGYNRSQSSSLHSTFLSGPTERLIQQELG